MVSLLLLTEYLASYCEHTRAQMFVMDSYDCFRRFSNFELC